MSLLSKLTLKNLRLNKKRTIVTIIGIMLSVALITAVATMYFSLIKAAIHYETYEKGYFHGAFYQVPKEKVRTIENTRGVEEICLTQAIGYGQLAGSKNEYKPYAFVQGFSPKSMQDLAVKLVEGRLPENDREILIPTHLKTNGRVYLKVGDTLTIKVGRRMSEGKELNQRNPLIEGKETLEDTVAVTYEIVGIMERPASNVEPYSAPGYTLITYRENQDMTGTVDVYARYDKKGSKNSEKTTRAIVGKNPRYEYELNTYLITLENNPLGDSTMGSFGEVVAIVCAIILVTSVFCIKNSFDISITEKIRQYGMLRSVGATGKQIRKNVFFEASVLGAIGIPLGLGAGFFAAHVLVLVSNYLLKGIIAEGSVMVLSYSWIPFAVAVALGMITIYLSAFRSARRASKVSPMDSIRNSGEIQSHVGKPGCPKWVKKTFGIGGEISYKNMKRNRRKYRTTIVSIAVSVAVFIPLSYFMRCAFDEIEQQVSSVKCNLILHPGSENEELRDKIYTTTAMDHVQDYAVHRTTYDYTVKKPTYNPKYVKKTYMTSKEEEREADILVLCIGDYQYGKYLKQLHLSEKECEGKAILIDYQTVGAGKEKEVLRRFTYQKGDEMILITPKEKELSMEIVRVTQEAPLGLAKGHAALIVSDKTYDEICDGVRMDIYFVSDNADKLQDEIETFLGEDEYELVNRDENARIMKNVYTLIAVFLYGFITVISLIGITNIFNTITTNMNLRRREFAMLKSIGMTGREFKSMIQLESVFMGCRALLFGVPIGVGLSYLICRALMEEESHFRIPIESILISGLVVYLLITLLMRYSMGKISRLNTIETIRNENI